MSGAPAFVSFSAEITRGDLAGALGFYLPILRPLGFRRDSADADRVVWQRRDEKITLWRGEAAAGSLSLRAPSVQELDALAALVGSSGAAAMEPEASRYRLAGWKAFGFRDPEGALLTLAYWHDDLPDVEGATRVRIPGAGIELGGYLTRPAGQGPFPAACLLHWYGGSALTALTSAKRLAEAGYVGLALSLRGWLGSEGVHDQGDKQSDDVVSALNWLGSQPDVDASRMALIGYSLGSQVGHLAVAKGAPVKAFVGFFGAADLNRWRETGGAETKMFFEDIGPPDYLRELSPITHVAKSRIPVLLIHGSADRQMPIEQSELMAAALRSAGRQVEFRVLEGADHLFTPEERAATLPWVTGFLDKTIR